MEVALVGVAFEHDKTAGEARQYEEYGVVGPEVHRCVARRGQVVGAAEVDARTLS